MQHKADKGRIPPSPCTKCTARCRNDVCRRWRHWFSQSWEQLQGMFE